MSQHDPTVLVVAGGEPVDPCVVATLPPADLVIAADSGVHHAAALGLRVDLVVGDLDSVRVDALEAAVAAGAAVERHPEAKDATDLELALGAARARGAARVVVLGIDGGRLDHFLANALLLASPALAPMAVEAWVGEARVFVVRDRVTLHGFPGDLLTLLPLGGPATGVRTTGLRYPLRGETLAPGSTRGVSNELTDTVAEVSLDDGVLLAVLPGHAGATTEVVLATAEERA